MDKEIQFLGLFGIYKEALNIITSYRKIFNLITLSVILPLSLVYSAQIQISDLLYRKIIQNADVLNDTPTESQKYYDTLIIIVSEFSIVLLLKMAYLIFFLIFTLFSTSAVVQTIACTYTAKEVTYKTVMKVVPKVWKRLMITLVWKYIILFASNMGVELIGLLWTITLWNYGWNYFMGVWHLVYDLLIFVWQLADVISILEDVCGTRALLKSMNLIKGKTGVCLAIFVINKICSVGIDKGFNIASVVGVDSVWGNVLHACVWSLLTSMSTLFGLIIQTIFYFICKSYHHENSYVLLHSKHVQRKRSVI